MSMHYKETNLTTLFIFLLQKSSWKIKRRKFKSDQKYLAKQMGKSRMP